MSQQYNKNNLDCMPSIQNIDEIENKKSYGN